MSKRREDLVVRALQDLISVTPLGRQYHFSAGSVYIYGIKNSWKKIKNPPSRTETGKYLDSLVEKGFVESVTVHLGECKNLECYRIKREGSL